MYYCFEIVVQQAVCIHCFQKRQASIRTFLFEVSPNTLLAHVVGPGRVAIDGSHRQRTHLGVSKTDEIFPTARSFPCQLFENVPASWLKTLLADGISDCGVFEFSGKGHLLYSCFNYS